MKKLLITIFCFFSILDSAHAVGKKYNSRAGFRDFCLKFSTQDGKTVNDRCIDIQVQNGVLEDNDTFFLLRTSSGNGGYTSLSTSDVTIPVSVSYVDKIISADPAFSSGTIADGYPGQIIVIEITEVEAGGTFTLTPERSNIFTSMTFEAVGDVQALWYINDTDGWAPLYEGSVQITR